MSWFSSIFNKKEKTKKEQCKETQMPQLQYEHNKFKIKLFDSFTVSSTGQKWIAVYKYEDVELYRPNTSFSEIFNFDLVDVVPEPNNEFDPKAVSVQFHGNVLGYLRKGVIQDMVHDYIAHDYLIRAQISNVDGHKINIRIYFCKPRQVVLPVRTSIEAKLSANSNSSMQSDIACCSVGDEITIDYNEDRDKYLVLSKSLELGYIPKSLHDEISSLEHDGYEFSGKVTNITQTPSGKYSVSVSILPE